MSGKETVAGVTSHMPSLGGVSAVCLGLPECLSAWALRGKCLWGIWQGGGTGLGTAHQPHLFEKSPVYVKACGMYTVAPQG